MRALQQLLLSISFFTQLPVPARVDLRNVRLADCAWSFPLVGALIGCMVGFVYIFMIAVGQSHEVAAWICIGFQLLLTGGLHEDGLADMADALAYGRNREQKLAIMRDSRIGTFGVVALIIVLATRSSAMTHFYGHLHGVCVFMAIGAASRTGMAVLMHVLSPARQDGLAASAGRVSIEQVLFAVALAFAALWYVVQLNYAMLGVIVLGVCLGAVGLTARRQFGGITGDVLGAAQQLAEVALFVALTSSLK